MSQPVTTTRAEWIEVGLMVLAAGVMLTSLLTRHSWTYLLGTCLYGLLMVRNWARDVRRAARQRREPKPVDPISEALEDPSDLSVCAVSLRVIRNEKTMGTDLGAMWIDGGNLYFSGKGCSFCIGGEDILCPDYDRTYRADREAIDPIDLICLRVKSGDLWVEIQKVSHPSNANGEVSRRFRIDLREFKTKRPQATSPRTYPPMTLRPVVAPPKSLSSRARV